MNQQQLLRFRPFGARCGRKDTKKSWATRCKAIRCWFRLRDRSVPQTREMESCCSPPVGSSLAPTSPRGAEAAGAALAPCPRLLKLGQSSRAELRPPRRVGCLFGSTASWPEAQQLLGFLVCVEAGQSCRKRQPTAKICAPVAQQRLNAERLAAVLLPGHRALNHRYKKY